MDDIAETVPWTAMSLRAAAVPARQACAMPLKLCAPWYYEWLRTKDVQAELVYSLIGCVCQIMPLLPAMTCKLSTGSCKIHLNLLHKCIILTCSAACFAMDELPNRFAACDRMSWEGSESLQRCIE